MKGPARLGHLEEAIPETDGSGSNVPATFGTLSLAKEHGGGESFGKPVISARFPPHLPHLPAFRRHLKPGTPY
jgi:hypothetical protein